MAPPRSVHLVRRVGLYGAGALLGLTGGFMVPGTTGCIYHDTCIKVTSAGHDWCRNVALAKQWPAGGSFEDAVPILRPDGGVPRGCLCYNDAENEILNIELPQCRFEGFVDDLEQAARQECEVLVMPGFDHNCWISSGPQASYVETEFDQGAGACVGNCEYGSPPPGGSCPEPSPYECGTGGHEVDACETEGDDESADGESSGGGTSDSTTGGALVDIDAVISCDEQECEIDEAFAWSLYADPSALLAQRTRLVYDAELQRHVFHGVEHDSLAHALGLRNGDILESVEDRVIDDLDSALEAYVQLGQESALHVRIEREAKWLDFTYTFVP